MSVILGGGVSGLSAAYYSLKFAPNLGPLTLVESSNRLGGWVRSIRTPEGLIFEQGPRTIRPKGQSGANTLKLVEELGLEPLVNPIPSTHPTAKNRLIFVNQKLHKLPSSPLAMLRKQSPFSKPLIFAIFHDLMTKSVPKSDESIYDFVSRRFGTELADYAVSAMICGICAGDAKKISVNFLMSNLFQVEQKHGGVLKGLYKEGFKESVSVMENSKLWEKSRLERWSVWSLEGGLQTIVQALQDNIKDRVNIKLNTTCTSIEFSGNQAKLILGDNSELVASKVISSLPAHKVGPLLNKQHPELARYLCDVEHVNVAVVNLAYKNFDLQQNAFGFLVPPIENLPILGVIFDSCCFKQNDWTVLTVMMGGSWFNKYFKGKTNDEILQIACKYTNEILKVPKTPDVFHVDVLRECIPQYTLGHSARVKNIQEYIEKHQLPLSLTGSSYQGVGINDVILASRRAVEKNKG